MSTPRKQSWEIINDSNARAISQPINIFELDENNMTVINDDTNGEYVVEIDNDAMRVISCTCPHYIYKCQEIGIYCKHMVAVANYLNYNL